MQSIFSFKRKIVGVRLYKIGFLPPGLYSTEILAEKKLPVLMLEFGNDERKTRYLSGKVPKIRFGDAWSKILPGTLRMATLIGVTAARIISRTLRGGKPALLVSHGLFEGLICFFSSKILNVPYFCYIHEVYDRSEVKRFNIYWWALLLEGTVLRNAQLLIFPEEGRAEVYRNRYRLNPSKIHLVFNCPRKRKNGRTLNLREKYGIPASGILMAYIGGVGLQNGLLEAIQALRNFPDLYFLIWGWTEHRTRTLLQDTAFRLGITDRVKMLGELKEEKWEVLSSCDLSYCVYTPCDLRGRHVATASNKLMEAVSCGVPAITTNRPDFKKIVEPYNLGTCADSITPEGISTAIEKLLSSPKLRSEISQSQQLWHEKAFNFEHQFEPVIGKFQKWI